MQIIYGFNNQVWSRIHENAEVFSDWVRLDNFGCSTPADLASLLGGIIDTKKFLVRMDGNREYICDLYINGGTAYIQYSNEAGYKLNVAEFNVTPV